ncbi:MAG: aspartate/glutamate racemase family protein [Hyphomicrobiaceae bacterium]
MMIVKGGQNIYSQRIGVLSLDSAFPKPPGHIKHPETFDFPIVYKIIKGIGTRELILEPGPHLLPPFIEGMNELEEAGVAAITGSCGFLALYQQELAAEVNVPVFMSSLIQVPLVAAMLGKGRSVGILTAVKSQLTPAHLAAVGAASVPVHIAGMDDAREFTDVIIKSKRVDMDVDRVREEVLTVAVALVNAHDDIGALVMECTDMPPYAVEIQEATGRPVFDLSTLTNMVAEAVRRQPYRGRWTP